MKNNRLVCGVGIKGKSLSIINGTRNKAYMRWKSMLRRCYVNNIPPYIGCSVCNEWLLFTNFEYWFEHNYIDGYELDKDILIDGNKVYSPETCCFVPSQINSLIHNRIKSNYKYPRGISYDNKLNKYKVQLGNKREYLGYFSNIDDANHVYLLAKKKNILDVANKYKDKITKNVYEALVKKSNTLI